MTGEAAEERGSVARSGSLPPEGSGKILTHSTADALRISDPRSASKPSAPADSEAASTSAFELITPIHILKADLAPLFKSSSLTQ